MRPLFLLLSLFFQTLNISAQKIPALEESLMSQGLDDKISVENQSSVDPNNDSNVLLSGVYVDSKNSDSFRWFVASSSDQGKTWTKLIASSYKETTGSWEGITNKGTLNFSALGSMQDCRDLTILTYRSTEQGKTWVKQPAITGCFDHQSMGLIDNE